MKLSDVLRAGARSVLLDEATSTSTASIDRLNISALLFVTVTIDGLRYKTTANRLFRDIIKEDIRIKCFKDDILTVHRRCKTKIPIGESFLVLGYGSLTKKLHAHMLINTPTPECIYYHKIYKQALQRKFGRAQYVQEARSKGVLEYFKKHAPHTPYGIIQT